MPLSTARALLPLGWFGWENLHLLAAAQWAAVCLGGAWRQHTLRCAILWMVILMEYRRQRAPYCAVLGAEDAMVLVSPKCDRGCIVAWKSTVGSTNMGVPGRGDTIDRIRRFYGKCSYLTKYEARHSSMHSRITSAHRCNSRVSQ